MSSSIISFPTIFFISSILILISNPKSVVASPSSPSLILKACSNDYYIYKRTKLCLDVLQSIPSVVSAKNLFDLSIAIIESGISNTTKTRTHVEAVLNQTNVNPRVQSTFRECKLSYDEVVALFKSALVEVKVKDYLAPTYDLKIASTDSIINCEKAMAKQNVKDKIIWRGNKVVPIFGMSAFAVIDVLDQLSSSPPPPKARLHY